jgi:hypothetical protein
MDVYPRRTGATRPMPEELHDLPLMDIGQFPILTAYFLIMIR